MSKRAVRIPVDNSGNQIGVAQESPGQSKLLSGVGLSDDKIPITVAGTATLSGALQAPVTVSKAASNGGVLGTPVTPHHSIRDLNEFLPAPSFKALDELVQGVAAASTALPQQLQAKLLGRRRGNSLHGSEGTIDTSISVNASASSDSKSADQSPTTLPVKQHPAAKQSADSIVSADSLIDNEHEDISLIIDLAQFPEFSAILTNTYWGPMTQNSTTLDIIAVYLKGQKILYIDSKSHCENSLNLLMMPTILISAICTVLSIALKDIDSGAVLVSCLTGVSTFILSIISFLKLDAKAQAHKTSAYQFDKLQTMCEFFSGKVLLIKDKDNETATKVQIFVNEIEKKVEEIKDTNQFIIPEGIRFRYSYIYSTNVFSQINKMKTAEKSLKNRLYFLVKEMDALPPDTNEIIRTQYTNARNKLLEDIVEHHNNLFIVDKMVNEEINKYGTGQKAKCCYNFWNWFKV